MDANTDAEAGGSRIAYQNFCSDELKWVRISHGVLVIEVLLYVKLSWKFKANIWLCGAYSLVDKASDCQMGDSKLNPMTDGWEFSCQAHTGWWTSTVVSSAVLLSKSLKTEVLQSTQMRKGCSFALGRYVSNSKIVYIADSYLTLVLLNPDIPCLCKQCSSRSVGFWRSQLIWICTVCH